jgi:hypothetical protein
MRCVVLAAAILALAGLTLSELGRAQTFEPGPGQGAGGAVLKDPYAPPAPANPAAAPGTPAPGTVDALINPTPTASPYPNPALGSHLQPPQEQPDINQDVQVTKELGPWMIMVQCYATPEASIMARQMVVELRTAHKLPAYTFNYGAEARRKEYERVKAVVEKQKEYLIKNNLPLDGNPIRVRTMRIEEQVGVLIGGYESETAARDALVAMRKKISLDPQKVMLDKKVLYGEKKKEGAPAKLEVLKEEFVNPFGKAFVVHNPTTKVERPADWDKLDMGLLHRLNAGEGFNLLHCKKQFTLAVKQFQTPTYLETKTPAGSFLESLKLGSKSGQRLDAAAESAHSLAELLRKAKLDAYVLHTKYHSIVTVGGYDSLEDPALRNMANLIETKVMPQIARYYPQVPNQPVVQDRVVPMQIPR